MDELLTSESDSLRERVISLDDDWDFRSDVWFCALKQVGVKKLEAMFLNFILY